MKARPYRRESSGAEAPTGAAGNVDHIAEALAKQAAMRPKKTPPKEMPVTPTLPKVKGRGRRRRRQL